MHLHAIAVLTVRQRQRLCDLVAGGVTITAAACGRWVFSADGVEVGQSGPSWCGTWRSLEPSSPLAEADAGRGRGSDPASAGAVARGGPHPVGWAVGVAASTVHAVLRRHGRSRLVTRPRPEAVVRYEYSRPGGLVHVDIKKLGRILKPGHRVTGDRSQRAEGRAGWQHLFVAIDDHSRLAFAAIYPDETTDSATAFLDELVRFYNDYDITVERVLTDNGTCFKRRWNDACNSHKIAVKKTRPYRPQTNGKAERFIRTMLERWAYAYTYENENARLNALVPALDFYNRFRPHRALGGLTPLQRVNNVPGTNS